MTSLDSSDAGKAKNKGKASASTGKKRSNSIEVQNPGHEKDRPITPNARKSKDLAKVGD